MDYLTALNKYTTIIAIAEEIDFKEQLVILYSNKGLCFMKNVNINFKIIFLLRMRIRKRLNFSPKLLKLIISILRQS